MELQRILASDTRTAMDKVFSLYGEDAMVVANNKVKGQTEIIVAIDLVRQVTVAMTKTPALVQGLPVEKDFGSFIESHLSPADEPDDHAETTAVAQSSPLAFGSLFEPRDLNKAPPLDPLVATPLDQVETSLDGENYKGAAEREFLKAREIVDLVKRELEIMRGEFKLAQQRESWSGALSVPEEMRPLIEAFNETGMPMGLRSLAVEIINQNNSMLDALTQICEEIGSSIPAINLLDNLAGLHIIAGSSGAGKTLMAGRIAKQAAANYGDNEVALISFNDLRIGAWTQTQIIGAQAGVETFRVNSVETLLQLIDELSTRKLTIIDTSGVDVEKQIMALIKAMPQAKKHLVLAADASEASAKRHLHASGIEWDSVMLSRLEARVHPWSIIHTLMANKTPVSVAAINPNITEPAIPLTGNNLAQQALSQLPIQFV